MKFVIGVFGYPATTALQFAQAVNQSGHTITQIFFYAEGVKAPSDDWSTLSPALYICQNSAQKYAVTQHTLPSGFQLSTLGQFMHALLSTDRYVVFGQ